MEIWTYWLILAGVLVILEIMTECFLVLWLGVAALISMTFSIFFPELFVVQIVIWCIASILLILCTKKITDKIKPKVTPTNVYSVIGKRAIVIQDVNIDKSSGQVKIDGDVWSAKAENPEEIIPVDSHVEILRVEGVKVIVKRV